MDPVSTDVVSVINARRSIRRGFSARPVADHVLDAILGCGCAAPSSKDAQPWVLHAVRDQAVLCAVADAMVGDERAAVYVPLDPQSGWPSAEYESSVRESAEVLRSVPLGVFLEDDRSFSGGRAHLADAASTEAADFAESLVGYAFEVFGIAAATQNMWLAAQSFGLVGVFLGDVVIAEDSVQQMLQIEGDLVGVLALGYSDAAPHAPRRELPGRTVVHS
jgi:nitroreductase